MLGAAPLLLRGMMHGSMEDGVWQPSDPAPDALEFAAARALRTLQPSAPEAGLWHAGVWQTVSQLDSNAAEDVQLRATKSLLQLASQHLPKVTGYYEMDEEAALLLQKQLQFLEVAQSIKVPLLLRAGAVPRLVSLVRDSPVPHVRSRAVSALHSLTMAPASLCAKVAGDCIAAGAVPALLHAAGDGSTDGTTTYEQDNAVSALVKLAQSSEEHRGKLVSQLMPILVGWLRTCDEENSVLRAALELNELLDSSSTAWQVAVAAGAVEALQQHPDVDFTRLVLSTIEHHRHAD